jgi:hypothetical protein
VGREKGVAFEEAAADLINDYRTDRRRSLRVVQLRLTTCLTSVFGHRRLMRLAPPIVATYLLNRKAMLAAEARCLRPSR